MSFDKSPLDENMHGRKTSLSQLHHDMHRMVDEADISPEEKAELHEKVDTFFRAIAKRLLNKVAN